jgi:hypothetical protein
LAFRKCTSCNVLDVSRPQVGDGNQLFKQLFKHTQGYYLNGLPKECCKLDGEKLEKACVGQDTLAMLANFLLLSNSEWKLGWVQVGRER